MITKTCSRCYWSVNLPNLDTSSPRGKWIKQKVVFQQQVFVMYEEAVVVVLVAALEAEVLTQRSVCPVSAEAPSVLHCVLLIFGCDCDWRRFAQCEAFRCNLKRRLVRKDCLEFSTCASCKGRRGRWWAASSRSPTSIVLLWFSRHTLTLTLAEGSTSVTYSFSLRLMLSSFDLTNTPSSPPRMRWTNSPSFALKMTLG